MLKLEKKPGRDFTVLNLSDPQLSTEEWAEEHWAGKTLRYTVAQLMERVHPDLVTVSGDISWAGQRPAYRNFADLMDSYAVPWAPVWGNHDNQGGPAEIRAEVEEYAKHPYCLYESGDPKLGSGNYVIDVREGEKSVCGIIMMDSHDRAPYIWEGKEEVGWAKLYPEQLPWYEEQIAALKAQGTPSSVVIMHIPIYAYNLAAEAAFRSGIDRKAVTLAESEAGSCWDPEYRDSVGVQHEGICSYPQDDEVFPLIQRLGHTTHLIAGHDHVNNFMIRWQGVNFVYSLKAGPGCYWEKELNGGTVLTVSSDGTVRAHHEYVNADHLLPQ